MPLPTLSDTHVPVMTQRIKQIPKNFSMRDIPIQMIAVKTKQICKCKLLTIHAPQQSQLQSLIRTIEAPRALQSACHVSDRSMNQ